MTKKLMLMLVLATPSATNLYLFTAFNSHDERSPCGSPESVFAPHPIVTQPRLDHCDSNSLEVKKRAALTRVQDK